MAKARKPESVNQNWPLPSCCNPETEPNKVLAKVKQSVWKKFKWSSAQTIYDAVRLAFLLHVFGRDDEALAICQMLGQYQKEGTSSNIWSPVEVALTLQSRLLRERGATADAAECTRRVRDAGFVTDRLKGMMLDRNQTVAEAVRTGDKRWEQGGRLILASELCFIIELGGSEECPVERIEQEWQSNLARLKELTGG